MAEQHKETGTVHFIGGTQTFGNKGFQKREIVLETGDKYKQYPVLEVQKDNCNLLDNLNIGDDVTLHFNLNGRENGGRYYNSLVVWKVEVNAKSKAPSQAEFNQAVAKGADKNGLTQDALPGEYDSTDLPF